MRKTLFGLWLLAISSSVSAYEFVESPGDWTVVAFDEGCGMTLEYEGPGATSLTFAKTLDGMVVISLTNYNWSAKKGQEYDVSYVLDGQAFSGAESNGYVNGGRSGFIASFNSSFEKHFAAGSNLQVFLGKDKIDQLSLDGSALAIGSLNRCMKAFRAAKAKEAQEAARWANLPTDPFRTSEPDLSALTVEAAPKPRGNPGSWATPGDYPSAALRARFKSFSSVAVSCGSACEHADGGDQRPGC